MVRLLVPRTLVYNSVIISPCTTTHLYTYIHTYILYINTYILYINAYIYICNTIHKYIHTIHKYICTYIYTYMSTHTQHQVRFGEVPSTDSEDFFSTIAKFIGQFKKVTLEMFPPPKPPKPRCATYMCFVMCSLSLIHAHALSVV